MYRQIVKPENTKLVLQIPASLVGKEIEITAQETGNHKPKKNRSKRRIELEKFYGRYAFDVSRLKLTREQANER